MHRVHKNPERAPFTLGNIGAFLSQYLGALRSIIVTPRKEKVHLTLEPLYSLLWFGRCCHEDSRTYSQLIFNHRVQYLRQLKLWHHFGRLVVHICSSGHRLPNDMS